MPDFDDLTNFNGRVLHAHDFRDALEFKGKDLLIIGTSYSAEDIGSQCSKYGARSITVSHRTAPMGYNWPDNWAEVPLLQNVEVVRFPHFDPTRERVKGNYDWRPNR